MNFKLIIAYDGATYQGWQKNRDLPTIEGVLQLAIEKILRHPVQLEAASRTDAGVHAAGQVVQFRTDAMVEHFIRRANSVLPLEIRALSIEEAPDEWHPSVDATSKEYHYQISNAPIQHPQERRWAWHVYDPLDINIMREAAQELLGTHDFGAFVNDKAKYGLKGTSCTLLRVDIVADTPWRIEIVGDRFLYKMVRNMVGTLVDIGAGRLPPDCIPALLAGGNRPEAGVCAPAHGLRLYRVMY